MSHESLLSLCIYLLVPILQKPNLGHRDGPEMRRTILLTCLHQDGECDSYATGAELGNTGAKDPKG